MVVRMTSDAASRVSGTHNWRRGPRAPKNSRAAPTGVNAIGWGRNRSATAKRMNAYASMDYLERNSILGAGEAGVKRGSRKALQSLIFDDEAEESSSKAKVRSQKLKVRIKVPTLSQKARQEWGTRIFVLVGFGDDFRPFFCFVDVADYVQILV